MPAVKQRPMANPKDTIVEHPTIDPEKVSGNASLELKREVVRIFSHVNPDHFASSIGARLEPVEISVVPKREDAQVMEARVVTEIDVLPGAFIFCLGRCNIDKDAHQECSTWSIPCMVDALHT